MSATDAKNAILDELRSLNSKLVDLPRKVEVSVPLDADGPRVRDVLRFGRRGGEWGLMIERAADGIDLPKANRTVDIDNMSVADACAVIAAIPRLCEAMSRLLTERDMLIRKTKPLVDAASQAITAVQMLGGAA